MFGLGGFIFGKALLQLHHALAPIVFGLALGGFFGCGYCRKTDRIDPTRVRRPCDRLGRGAPTPDSASLCPLLQRSENAPLVGQRCAILAPSAADRKHHVKATPRRIASPLHASLSFRYTH